MKKLIFLIGLISQLSSAHAVSSPAATLQTKVYGIHLYFDEKEFVDELTLRFKTDGSVEGSMHVPNDFDGESENLIVTDKEISFDVLVPKNSSRPQNLVFHYVGTFFAADQRQIVGFVTLKGQNSFVASFTGFLRD